MRRNADKVEPAALDRILSLSTTSLEVSRRTAYRTRGFVTIGSKEAEDARDAGDTGDAGDAGINSMTNLTHACYVQL